VETALNFVAFELTQSKESAVDRTEGDSHNYKKATTISCVHSIRFEWNETKDLTNQGKHGLSFESAAQVFRDPLQVMIPDRIENGEERWKTFGLVHGTLLVVVAHTLREEEMETVVRIISARRATRFERRFYEEENS
jgi:uncharacterized protein